MGGRREEESIGGEGIEQKQKVSLLSFLGHPE